MFVYVDTSVIGGCFDVSYQEAASNFFRRCETGWYYPCFSDITLAELVDAPWTVQDFAQPHLPTWEFLAVLPGVVELARQYISESVIRPTKLNDAYHVACATFHEVEILATWDYRYLVNVRQSARINAVNRALGFAHLDIRTRLDLL